MKVSQATIEIRPRTGAEIIDLGVLFYRRYFGLFSGLSILLGGPMAVIAFGVHHLSGLWWLALALYLPLLALPAGAIVLAASRIVFGTSMTIGSTLQLYRAMWPSFFFRRFFQNLLSVLLLPILVGYIMRLSALFQPPSVLLERLSGRELNVRVRGLGRRGGGNLFAFDCLLILTMAAFCAGIVVVLEIMLGDVFTVFGESGLRSAEVLDDPVRFAVWMVVGLVVFPVYALGWFFRYLDARIRGEGWDLELGFRNAAVRLDPNREGGR